MEQYNILTKPAPTSTTPLPTNTVSQRDYYRLLEQLERQDRAIRRLEGELAAIRDAVRARS